MAFLPYGEESPKTVTLGKIIFGLNPQPVENVGKEIYEKMRRTAGSLATCQYSGRLITQAQWHLLADATALCALRQATAGPDHSAPSRAIVHQSQLPGVTS